MIQKFFNKVRNHTVYKYFFSYLILFTVLIVGFWLILKKQLEEQYFEQLSIQAEQQLNSFVEQLEEDVLYLSQVDSSLAENTTLIMSRYKKESWYNYETLSEIRKYDAATKLINGIVYKVDSSDAVLSTQDSVIFKENTFQFYREGLPALSFDAHSYLNYYQSQLIFLADEHSRYLIYMPKRSLEAKYLMFYTLDIFEICQTMEAIVSDTIPAIALMADDNRMVTGVGEQMLASYMNDLDVRDGVFKLDASNSLCVKTGINSGFYMVALISNDSLLQQISTAFASSYLMLLMLGTVGFGLVIFAMRITYLPLHRLIKKNIPNFQGKSGYIEQLEQTFSEFEEYKQQLEGKIEKYRLSAQRALMDSIVFSTGVDEMVKIPNMDQFFELDSVEREIFVIRIKSTEKSISYQDVQEYLEALSGKDSCAVLEKEKDTVVFLMNYVGTENNKSDALKGILIDFYVEYGYLSAISNGSSSLMDIPLLYKNAEMASRYWNDIPVSDYTVLCTTSTNYAYPYEKLEQLSEVLNMNEGKLARKLIDELFEVIDKNIYIGDSMTNFFTQCILIDILTIQIKAMSQANIKFKVYSDIYFETLYFCRSCSYSEKRDCLLKNVKKLLAIYEREIEKKNVKSIQIRAIIEESYSDPDFSIAVMADYFKVSVTHISYLVKKELNENFVDYLWKVRLKKAKELLKDTEMSIDEVSIAVGYLNTSSFRRKFKQEVGVTPSQYRTTE